MFCGMVKYLIILPTDISLLVQDLRREMELELAKQREELNKVMEEKLLEELEVRGCLIHHA